MAAMSSLNLWIIPIALLVAALAIYGGFSRARNARGADPDIIVSDSHRRQRPQASHPQAAPE